jgi:hypothetical protein
LIRLSAQLAADMNASIFPLRATSS